MQPLDTTIVASMTRLFGRLDWLIHESVQQEGFLAILRARILAVLGLVCGLMGPLISIGYFRLGRPGYGLVFIGCGATGLVVFELIRRTGAMRLCAHLACLSFYAATLAGMDALGGPMSIASRWFALIPALGILFGGLGTGSLWFLICWATFCASLFLPGYTTEYLYVHDLAHDPKHQLVAMTTFMVMVFSVVGGSELMREWLIREVQKREERTKTILESTPDGILIVSEDGRVRAANRTGKHLLDGILDARELAAMVLKMKNKKSSSQWESHGVHFELETAPLRAIEDASSEVVMIARDVTARRAHALMLQQAFDDAREASEAKNQFFTMMSHELRTPLGNIIGYADMLLDDIDNDDYDAIMEDAQAISMAGQHLIKLVSDSLDLAKIESGKLLLAVEDCDITELVNELERTTRPMIRKRGNTLRVDTTDARTPFATDAPKLRQVLTNLLSNAAKFTEDGAIFIRARVDEEGCMIQVEDTGIGMSEEQLELVWDEFVQGDASTLNAQGGTGLGLALVRRLTEHLGGTIDATSAPGEGSIFTLEIPHWQPIAFDDSDE